MHELQQSNYKIKSAFENVPSKSSERIRARDSQRIYSGSSEREKENSFQELRERILSVWRTSYVYLRETFRLHLRAQRPEIADLCCTKRSQVKKRMKTGQETKEDW